MLVNSERIIYLDNAASTRPYQCIIDKMSETSLEVFGNPSALHPLGVKARGLLEDARACIADTIHAEPEEIYFTSGATEANNWVGKIVRNRNYFYCSAIEHKSVLTLAGHSNFILASNNGYISPADLSFILNQRGETIVAPLISVMYANNEIGTVQPIEVLSDVVHRYGGIFHTDATQAYTKVPIDVKAQHIDMLSASGHKIHGPRGVGFLYISNEIKDKIHILPFLEGGGQESGYRAGTENVPAIVGMAEAAKKSIASMHNDREAIRTLRNYACDAIMGWVDGMEGISKCYSNIDILSNDVLPGILNLLVKDVDAQELVVMAAERGVCISSGSACNMGNPEPSHVLKAIGLSDEDAKSSIRLSLSYETTKKDIDTAINILRNCVNSLRMYV